MKLEYYKIKKLIIGFGFAYIPLGIIAGIFSWLGKVPINVNGEAQYGFTGFLSGILVFASAALALSVICYLFLNLGIAIYNLLIGLFKRGDKG